MDPLAQLLSFSFIIFSLLIGGITFIIRTVIEFFFKNAPNNRLWEDLILPIVPLLIGLGLAYVATMYPYPTGFTSVSGRLAFGGVAGLLSGLLYRLIKSMLKQKIGTADSITKSQSATATSSSPLAASTQSDDAGKEHRYMGSDLYK